MWFFSAKRVKTGRKIWRVEGVKEKVEKVKELRKGSPAHETEGYEGRSTERDGHKVKANLYLTRQNDIN